MILKHILPILEQIAPSEYAMANDPIGLQVGDPGQEVRRILVTVDVTPAVAEEAVRQRADLIIPHHPLIYNPLTSVRSDTYPQSMVYRLIRAGIALYAMHTNYDAAVGGINDVLADRLGVVDTKVLKPTYTESMFKLVVFVPDEAVRAVHEALAEAGAGHIGNYSHCTFQTQGTGTFLPLEGADPYLGEVGRLERAIETRLETIVPERLLHTAVSAMLAAHPYEEVAYDVYPLRNQGGEWGIGRYGKLRNPMTFEGFCEMVQDVLEVEDARIQGDSQSTVETVALIGGGGGGDIGLAHARGVDAYVTGDIANHEFVLARALALNIIDAGHFHTERPGMMSLAPHLQDILSPEGIIIEYADDLTL